MTTSTDPTELKLLQVREQIRKHIKNPIKGGNNLFNALISPGPASITLLQINNNTKSNNIGIKSTDNIIVKGSTRDHTNTTTTNSTTTNNNGMDIISTNINSSSNRSLSSSSSSNLSTDSSFEKINSEINQNDNFKLKNNTNSSNNNDPKGLVAAAAISLAVTKPFPLKKIEKYKFLNGNRDNSIVDNNKCNDRGKLLIKNANKRTDYKFNPNFMNKNTNVVDDSYILPQTTNIISCFCGNNDPINIDKDAIIQCNNCHRWQHLHCFNLKSKFEILPINFYCKICKPNLDLNNYRISKKRKFNSLLNSKNSLLMNSSLRKNPISNLHNLRDKSTNILHSNGTQPNNNSNNTNILSNNFKQEILFNIPNNNSSVTGGMQADSFENQITSRKETSLNESTYADKYVKQFIEMHSNDDWVSTQNKSFQLPNLYDLVTLKEISNDPNFAQLMGVYCNQKIIQNTNIMEIIGLIDFQKNYILDSTNQYRIWGTTQSGVFFHPHWPLLIDCRKNTPSSKTGDQHESNSSLAGDKGALIYDVLNALRRSCKPNVVLRTIKPSNEDKEVKFILTAKRDIEIGEELTIDWQWDLRHPINNLIMDCNQVNLMNDMDKFWLVHSVDTIWCKSFCACTESYTYVENNTTATTSTANGLTSKEITCPLLRAKLFSDQFHKDLQPQKFK